MEETPEQYIERIRSMTGYDIMTIVPDTAFYREMAYRRTDLNLTIKGSFAETGINGLVLAAINKANEIKK